MSKWRPASELPRLHIDELGDFQHTIVLVWVDDASKGNEINFGYYSKSATTGRGKWKANGFGGNHEWNITHWQYLPKPPRRK